MTSQLMPPQENELPTVTTDRLLHRHQQRRIACELSMGSPSSAAQNHTGYIQTFFFAITTFRIPSSLLVTRHH